LTSQRAEREAAAAVVRVEQLYPWPSEQIRDVLERYPSADEVYWVQDEPENMGPWPFAHERLHKLLRDRWTLRHRSRFQSASPASGSHVVHEQEAEQLMQEAFEDL
jgi:2-oxoglutarate dehydrogenase complex dehydrogenase (E1) component-like enzyme